MTLHPRRRRTRGRLLLALAALVATLPLLTVPVGAAHADGYVPINGAGSSWSSNAIDQWRRNVEQYGMRINYASTGSSDGRNQFKAGTVDFASTEIPYGLKDGGVLDTLPTRSFAYMPIVAGGTAFMYNLQVGGHRVTNLRLSGEVLTKIFTGVITSWDDAAIKADNPGLALPPRKIVPVVRSDGSGSTAQFSTWMAARYPSLWNAYCAKAGRSTPCGVTSNFPTVAGKGFVSQPNSQGVAGYVAQTANQGTITYVEYSYALKTGYPVAKILNAAGYYVEPTASNVAVALLSARINDDKSSPAYLTQDLSRVYTSTDPRTYPLSSYSYVVVPTATQNGFTEAKGKTLGAFAYYFLCEGQQQAPVLGYSPLPVNLVKAGLAQVRRIPGVAAQSIDIKSCHNPTFSADGSNTLAKNAPQPSECDKLGTTQCSTGTGGAKGTTTPVTSGKTPPGKGTSTGSTSGGTGAGTGTGTGAGTGTGTGTSGTGATGKGTGTGTGTGTGGAAAGTDAGAAPGTDAAGAAGGTTSVVAADYGGGPVSCEADTGVCQAVAGLPVQTDKPSSAGAQQLAAVLAVLLVLGAILAPPLVARARRGASGGGRA
ncbi:phosphate ABC transporter substrate-binding protein PstS [Luteimicrobium subarcticum]|uniref:Phosphate ABC transporter substrate-binding protein (PhoT family) n=1 Tax=Luteimicrobium subarcticum TaxID=620910 RepID=A0A2M8WT66_9MICO|nr:phosphate ABC transporter substrate-binding protein PstS [Luteimicrobium subarcticum]PJI94036.1 phosphate ABC transporter substrate-binding protein (PhoT family) [Luteimicrobium subarcticum]